MQEEENQAEIPKPVGKPKTKKFWAALIAVDCAALALFSFLAYRYLDDQPAQSPATVPAASARQPENQQPAAPAPRQKEEQPPEKSTATVPAAQVSESSPTAVKLPETKPEEKLAVSTKTAAPQHADAPSAQAKSTAALNGNHPAATAKKIPATPVSAAKTAIQAKPAAQVKTKAKPAAQIAAPKPQNNGKYSGIANGAKVKEPAAAAAKARPIYFTYQNNTAKSVAVTGSFTIWKPIPMHKNGNYWESTIYIHSGKYEYSLMVDGKTIADPAAPAKGPERSFLLVP